MTPDQFELHSVPEQPDKAQLKVDCVVDWRLALKILEMLKEAQVSPMKVLPKPKVRAIALTNSEYKSATVLTPTNILRLANLYCAAENIALSTLGKRACRGNHHVFHRMKSGQGTNSRTLAKIEAFFYANWPNNAPWPPDLGRGPSTRPNHLQEWRRAAGKTQIEVEDILSWPRSRISHLENSNDVVTEAVLKALAPLYGCEPTDLLRSPWERKTIEPETESKDA
jgi:hypothetical protein